MQRETITLGTLLALLLSATTLATAANLNTYCRCSDITPVKLWDADAWLWLSRSDKDQALSKHLPWGVPMTGNADNEKLLIQTDYVINHDGDLRTATWVGYQLKKSTVETSRTRTECFRKDNRVRKNHAGLCADYKESTYDQGHLAPNSDMKRTLRSMINSYMMSNMAPQHCNFNRGSWLVLEGLTRHWAKEHGEIHVLTGAVFDRGGTPGRDADSDALRMASDNGNERVAVPSHFYKILTREKMDGGFETLSILLEHTNDKLASGSSDKQAFYNAHVVSINDIEAVTGINFFPGLEASDPALAATLESNKPTEVWALPSSWPGRMDHSCN